MSNEISNCSICRNQGSFIEKYLLDETIFASQPIFNCSKCSYSWNNTIT